MKILDVRNKSKNKVKELLLLAAKAIKKAELVVFPTETVYGLGADCFNILAVNKIFIVKNRPYNRPLIVHIGKFSDIEKVVLNIPKKVEKLIETFWPGPLSLVLKKHPSVPEIVTAGKDNVCVRMPQDIIARQFIELCNTPVVGTSANISSKISPTELDHIVEDFKNIKEIKYILYSGKCKYGIESTILDCTVYPFRILRYGAVEVEKINDCLGMKISEPQYLTSTKTKESSYNNQLFLKKQLYIAKNLLKYIKTHKISSLKQKVFICSDETKQKIVEYYGNKLTILHYGQDLPSIAENLYLCLRLADRLSPQANEIIIEAVEPRGIGKSIMDRIIKIAKNRWV